MFFFKSTSSNAPLTAAQTNSMVSADLDHHGGAIAIEMRQHFQQQEQQQQQQTTDRVLVYPNNPDSAKAVPSPSTTTAADQSIPAHLIEVTDDATQQLQQPPTTIAPRKKESLNPAIGGGRRATNIFGGGSEPKETAEERAERKRKEAQEKQEEEAKKEAARRERERQAKLLAGTGISEIGSRITKMLLVDEFTDQLRFRAPPRNLSRELRATEEAVQYKSWLRGILTFLAVLSFVCSLIDIQMQPSIFSHWANMVICLIGMGCVIMVYQVKARLAGVQNPLYGEKASLIHSPYLAQMFLELSMWIFTPPYLVSVLHIYWLGSLDFISFFRLYNIALWFSNRTYVQRTFCRAMSSFSGIKLSTGFYMRTSMVYRKMETSLVTVLVVWTATALAFSVAEQRTYQDSFYFIFVTAGTIGYGDIYPVTLVGRMAAFVAWIFGLLVIGWCVSIFQMYLNLKEHEKNLYILFRTNELSSKIRIDSATLIQRAFRIHMRNKITKNHSIFTDIALWRLARLTDKLKEMRREFKMHVTAYSQVMETDAAPNIHNDYDLDSVVIANRTKSMQFNTTGAKHPNAKWGHHNNHGPHHDHPMFGGSAPSVMSQQSTPASGYQFPPTGTNLASKAQSAAADSHSHDDRTSNASCEASIRMPTSPATFTGPGSHTAADPARKGRKDSGKKTPPRHEYPPLSARILSQNNLSKVLASRSRNASMTNLDQMAHHNSSMVSPRSPGVASKFGGFPMMVSRNASMACTCNHQHGGVGMHLTASGMFDGSFAGSGHFGGRPCPACIAANTAASNLYSINHADSFASSHHHQQRSAVSPVSYGSPTSFPPHPAAAVAGGYGSATTNPQALPSAAGDVSPALSIADSPLGLGHIRRKDLTSAVMAATAPHADSAAAEAALTMGGGDIIIDLNKPPAADDGVTPLNTPRLSLATPQSMLAAANPTMGAGDAAANATTNALVAQLAMLVPLLHQQANTIQQLNTRVEQSLATQGNMEQRIAGLQGTLELLQHAMVGMVSSSRQQKQQQQQEGNNDDNDSISGDAHHYEHDGAADESSPAHQHRRSPIVVGSSSLCSSSSSAASNRVASEYDATEATVTVEGGMGTNADYISAAAAAPCHHAKGGDNDDDDDDGAHDEDVIGGRGMGNRANESVGEAELTAPCLLASTTQPRLNEGLDADGCAVPRAASPAPPVVGTTTAIATGQSPAVVPTGDEGAGLVVELPDAVSGQNHRRLGSSTET